MSNAKKLKLCSEQMKNEGDEDRISNLPKSILHHIFSFLDMIDVVQTSILSRTWRYLWTSHPVLNFDCEVFYSKKETRAEEAFRDFVDEVLILRDGSDLQSFRLNCCRPGDYTFWKSRLSTWIISAIRRNVQELYLDVYFTEDFQFPDCFFTCKSLAILELKSSKFSIQFNIPDSISLPRLKTLLLQCVDIDADDIPKILSSCPVLESFNVTYCRFNEKKNLDISSVTLKHLVIEDCVAVSKYGIDPNDYRVKLCVPNLISFRCKDFMWKFYSIENLSSLVKAEIDQDVEYPGFEEEVDIWFAERMINFLRALQNVELLTLSAWFVEVVTRAPALLETLDIQLCNLRCLKLETWLSRNCVESMTYLLKISPNIQSLFVEINTDDYRRDLDYPYWDEVWFNSTAKIEAYWEAAGVSLQCMMHHLKFVEVRGVQGYVEELIFLESLLKNAMVLEKLVIITFKEESPHTERERQFIKFGEKLLTLPRASSSVGILVI